MVGRGTVTRLAGEVLRQRCIEAVVEEGELFGIVSQQLAAGPTPATGGLDARVPWVPDWAARDLVGHLGTVHRWATTILRAGHTQRPAPDATRTPPHDGLIDWYAEGLTELISTLRTTPPDAPAWHMSPTAEKTAASWARRQAHELVVHRMDLEVAAGLPHSPVDADLAEDGVDELLTVVVPRWAHTEPLSTARATAAVTATDTRRTWSLSVDRGAVTVRSERSGTEDAHLQGEALQLLLRLWGRPADVTVDGDPAAEALLRGR
ncbi:maleylpyruvate isomerase family mycothiol-dependent enzyme [Blastococcus sp. CT_GayMR20]|nr:maleylpyruvate isomerase family mycothiol-dependent enzyme [Blastococcus sp. CT_GayMR20]TFV82754.1 maleylpyruvate isomerase family mycothiol-dependent enzyme [Blastococcus sp. CT_GayMR20]